MKKVVWYKDKRIEDLTRDELIEALYAALSQVELWKRTNRQTLDIMAAMK